MKKFLSMLKICICFLSCAMIFLFSACSDKIYSVDKVEDCLFTNNNIFTKSVFKDAGVVDGNLNNSSFFKTGMAYCNDNLYYANYCESGEINILGRNDCEKINYYGGEFTVYNNKLYCTNNKSIVEKSLQGDSEREIISGDTFCFWDEYLITRQEKSILGVDLQSLKCRNLFDSDKEILWYSVYNDRLYVIYRNNQLCLSTIDLNNNTIISKLDLDFYVVNFIACVFDDNIVICNGNRLYNINLSTGKQEDVFSYEDIIAITGVNDKLYFVVQNTRQDGSVQHNIQSNENGLWQYDIVNHDKNRISDKIFSRIYICSDECVFAAKLNKYDFGFFAIDSSVTEFYQINPKNKSERRIV